MTGIEIIMFALILILAVLHGWNRARIIKLEDRQKKNISRIARIVRKVSMIGGLY